MAHHKSAIKRIRQTERRRVVNKMRVGEIRTFIKKVESAIVEGNKTVAQEAFKAAQPILMSGVTKGVLHRNTVSRKLSRLSAGIKALV
jgi:small subunit ribosomal protein S20